MRNVLRLNGLVIAADNSGAVGSKPGDAVNVPYETVGYFAARVAFMECLAAGGEPFAAIVQNFSGDDAWLPLCAGIQKAAREAGCSVEITGSTESNFSLLQSATGLVILGKETKPARVYDRENVRYGVVGKPLSGKDVMKKPEDVAPLAVFRLFLDQPFVSALWPAGSKGILHELKEMSGHTGTCGLDLFCSAGPSTCFLIAVDKADSSKAEKIAPVHWFHLSEKT